MPVTAGGRSARLLTSGVVVATSWLFVCACDGSRQTSCATPAFERGIDRAGGPDPYAWGRSPASATTLALSLDPGGREYYVEFTTPGSVPAPGWHAFQFSGGDALPVVRDIATTIGGDWSPMLPTRWGDDGQIQVGVCASGPEGRPVFGFLMVGHFDVPDASSVLSTAGEWSWVDFWRGRCADVMPCSDDPSVWVDPTGVPYHSNGMFIDASAPVPLFSVGGPVGGDWTLSEIGLSATGARILSWHPRGSNVWGATPVVALFDWFEQLLGPLPFEVAGPSLMPSTAGGPPGSPHLPHWSIGEGYAASASVHAEYMARAWTSAQVGIGCWGESLLVVGLPVYLSLIALEEVVSPSEAAAAAATLDAEVSVLQAGADLMVWRDCLDSAARLSPPQEQATRVLGARFFREVEAVVGRDALLATIRAFVGTTGGELRSTSQLIDALPPAARAEIDELAAVWLRSECPPGVTCS